MPKSDSISDLFAAVTTGNVAALHSGMSGMISNAFQSKDLNKIMQLKDIAQKSKKYYEETDKADSIAKAFEQRTSDLNEGYQKATERFAGKQREAAEKVKPVDYTPYQQQPYQPKDLQWIPMAGGVPGAMVMSPAQLQNSFANAMAMRQELDQYQQAAESQRMKNYEMERQRLSTLAEYADKGYEQNLQRTQMELAPDATIYGGEKDRYANSIDAAKVYAGLQSDDLQRKQNAKQFGLNYNMAQQELAQRQAEHNERLKQYSKEDIQAIANERKSYYEMSKEQEAIYRAQFSNIVDNPKVIEKKIQLMMKGWHKENAPRYLLLPGNKSYIESVTAGTPTYEVLSEQKYAIDDVSDLLSKAKDSKEKEALALEEKKLIMRAWNDYTSQKEPIMQEIDELEKSGDPSKVAIAAKMKADIKHIIKLYTDKMGGGDKGNYKPVVSNFSAPSMPVNPYLYNKFKDKQ